MLLNVGDLDGFTIAATDGDLGQVRDFYFDDTAWVIRYLVVETGTWLAHRKVLVSPIAIGRANLVAEKLATGLSRDQVRNSPDIDTDKPVSRQHEQDYFGYYGYPYYWGGVGMWGDGFYPGAILPGYAQAGASTTERAAANADYARAAYARHRHDDPHLRSCQAVTGYHIGAADGEIGHVQGMLVDDEAWAIRYLIVNTSNWWLGHQVLIAPECISDVSWAERKVTIDMSRQSVRDAPPYDPKHLPDHPGAAPLPAARHAGGDDTRVGR